MNFTRFLNFKSVLIGVAIFGAVFAVLAFSGKIPIFNSTQKQKFTGTLQVWGTIPKSAMTSFVDMFDKEAKSYNMVYTEVKESELNDKLISALADGYAPDLLITPSEVVFANQNRLLPVSLTSISESDFRNLFIDSASILITGNGYLGLPLSIDPLVLYYNRDILSSNGYLNPPLYWGDFYDYDNKITKKDGSSNLTMSTIAFGTYNNIPHITDILLAMIIQQGQVPIEKTFTRDSLGNSAVSYQVNLDTPVVAGNLSPLNSALAYTKDFADSLKPTYNWDVTSKNALLEFISGNLAFYIGFASEANYIKSANQKLYFDFTTLPQVDNSKLKSTYGNLYTISMLRTSSNQELAYQVMIALATGEFSQYLVSLTGGISALKANIASGIASGDHQAQVFGESALISKTFYDLHRKDLETLMGRAINQIYSGEKSTVEASQELSSTLQSVYNSNK